MRVQLAVLLMLVAGCQRSSDVCPGSDPGVGPVPDFVCTQQLVGSMVCPGGQIGYGYQCTDDACWRLFADGPCTPAFSADAGGVDAGTDAGVCPGSACTQQGDLQCDGSNRLQQCQQGCFVQIGTCGIDGGADGGLLCGAPLGGTRPRGACTAERAGATICPGGPGSGTGFDCSDAGCWNPFLDGPCSAPYDSGVPPCGLARRCPGEEGRITCRGDFRSVCSSGCWLDLDVCTPDGG